MEIRQILEKKRDLLPLLLIGDEQEDMIGAYLDRCALFALYGEGGPLAVCALTEEGGGTFEIRNLAVETAVQRRGYGRILVEFAAGYAAERGGNRLLAATGDSPLTVPFYRACGFREQGRVRNYFLTHYDHPIREGGVLLRDQVLFSRPLSQGPPAGGRAT